VVTTPHGDGRVTWTAAVERQTYNGVVTPAYREGDHVIIELAGIPDWRPEGGTVVEVRGHSLKVKRNGGGHVECVDYEVRQA
jgi:hypothetical protein